MWLTSIVQVGSSDLPHILCLLQARWSQVHATPLVEWRMDVLMAVSAACMHDKKVGGM